MKSNRALQWSCGWSSRSIWSGLVVVGWVAAAASLGACAIAPEPVPLAAPYQRVGVVSLAAGELTQRGAGYENRDRVRVPKPSVRDIANWQVDRAYEEQLAAAVQVVMGITVVKAPAPAGTLAALNDPGNPYVQPGFWQYHTDPVAATLREYCADNRLDALVVATQSTDEDVLGGTYQAIAGAGVYDHGGNHLVHLSAALRLVDCETGRTLEHRHLASSRSFAASHGYPVRALPEALTRKGNAQWTSTEESQLRQLLIALPADAWVDTLEDMVHPGRPPVPPRALMPNS